MKKAIYLVLSLGAALFLGLVFYMGNSVQASPRENTEDGLVVETDDFETEVETTQTDRPRNNSDMMRGDGFGRMMDDDSDIDCPFREGSSYLDEDCPFRGEGRSMIRNDEQDSGSARGRMMSNGERPCRGRR